MKLSRQTLASLLALAALTAGCAGTGSSGNHPESESIYAVTAGNALLGFGALRPEAVRSRVQISGLEPGESLVGLDVRPANGRLYAASSAGRLLVIDPHSGMAQPVGTTRFSAFIKAGEIGFDFNPVVDRLRVVDASGTNLRLHPDTGAVVDADPKAEGVQIDGRLAYAPEDPNEGKAARVTGAAYTHGAGAKATTNYAIDSAQAMLVTQGTREGDAPAKPPVTPNAGRLFSIGPLGVAPGERVGFDISHASGAAYVTFTSGTGSVLYSINLETGAATRLGVVGQNEQVRGIAVAP